MSLPCGCKSWGTRNGDMETHRCDAHEFLVECRRCGLQEEEEMMVEGLCPECMRQAGLVDCCHCGRAFAREIATEEKLPLLKPLYWCPFCQKERSK